MTMEELRRLRSYFDNRPDRTPLWWRNRRGHEIFPPARAEAQQRAGGRCEDCGATDRPLECHHEDYNNPGAELPEELAMLCRTCHHGRHTDLNGDFWTDPLAMEEYWFTYWEERDAE